VDSDPLSRVGPYSGAGRETFFFGIRDYHTLWSVFPNSSARRRFGNSHTPGPSTPPGRTFPSPSANDDAFLLLAGSAVPAKRPHNPGYATPAARLRLDGRRIFLPTVLRGYPGTTIARDSLVQGIRFHRLSGNCYSWSSQHLPFSVNINQQPPAMVLSKGLHLHFILLISTSLGDGTSKDAVKFLTFPFPSVGCDLPCGLSIPSSENDRASSALPVQFRITTALWTFGLWLPPCGFHLQPGPAVTPCGALCALLSRKVSGLAYSNLAARPLSRLRVSANDRPSRA
jgi:hypothetical protein